MPHAKAFTLVIVIVKIVLNLSDTRLKLGNNAATLLSGVAVVRCAKAHLAIRGARIGRSNFTGVLTVRIGRNTLPRIGGWALAGVWVCGVREHCGVSVSPEIDRSTGRGLLRRAPRSGTQGYDHQAASHARATAQSECRHGGGNAGAMLSRPRRSRTETELNGYVTHPTMIAQHGMAMFIPASCAPRTSIQCSDLVRPETSAALDRGEA